MKALANKGDTSKKDEGTSVGATATVTAPTTEHTEEINALYGGCDDEETEAGWQNNMADVQLNHSITAEKLQTRMHYWSSKDPKAMESDKKCIVCHKRNMNWPRYQDHLKIQHSLNMLMDDSECLDVEHVISAWEIWMENETPTPNPRLYDSVNECEISEFDSASEDDNDDKEPPKLIPLPAKLKRTEPSSAESASESEDYQSDSSTRSRPNKSRQQISKKLKEVSNHVDTLNENVGNFEGRLVGIEDNVDNISENLKTMNSEHKSGLSSLKTTVEKGSKAFDEKLHQVHCEMKNMQNSHAESSNKLKMELEKSQELSKNLNDKLKKSQSEQKESSEELKKLQEESSKEIQGLKENITEIMTFLKNEWKSPSDHTKTIEKSGDSGSNNKTKVNGIVSITNPCIPPEVMTSPIKTSMIDEFPSVVKRTLEEGNSEEEAHSISDPPTVSNHNFINLDSAAVQPPMVDQVQDSSAPAVDPIQLSSVQSVKKQINSQEEIPSSESIQKMVIKRSFDVIKDVTSIFKSPMGIIYMMLFMMMFNVGISRAATIPEQDNFLSPNAFSRLQPDQNMIIFDATAIDTKDFLFDLGEINHGIHTGINSSCNTINAMNKQCALHPENCQAASLAIINLESSIEKNHQTKYALQRVCSAGEVPSFREVIRRCHAGEDWESQFRGKRYVPSRAVPSGTAT